jgi:hypothetical protein
MLSKQVINSSNKLYSSIMTILKPTHTPPQLGRWNLSYGKKIDHKVDLANEDHCGPCGELKMKNVKAVKK